MNRPLLRPLPSRDESGVALLTVILMLALVSALTLTIAVVATNNLVSARLSQQAGAAVNASDAGISQAITYLRRKGTSGLSCSPTCASNPWGNSTTPTTVTVSGRAGQSYKVWIEPIAPYPANKPGVYRIHSTGFAGGAAGRTVTVDASIMPLPFVFGIVAGSVSGGGNTAVHHESIFSTGCVSQRDKILFAGLDAAFGIPAAVHSTDVITVKNDSGKTCPTGDSIHSAAAPCNTSFKYDQDKMGAPLTSTTGCYNTARSDPDPTVANQPQYNDSGNKVAYNYPQTSLLDAATMASLYQAKRPPFTQAQLDQLKAAAQSDGTYYTSATGFTVPPGPDAIMYFNLTGAPTNARIVDLNDIAVSPWNRDHDPATCPTQSLLIIIEGGDARLNSNSKLSAAVFLTSDDPYGNVTKANGTATFTGSLYANNVDLTGTSDLWMDQCFINNPPPTLNTVTTYNYREVDR